MATTGAILLLRADRRASRSLVAGAVAGVLLAVAIVLWIPLGLSARPLLLIEPDLFGHPLQPGGFRSFEAYTDINGGYVGIAALGLGCVAALVGSRRGLAAVGGGLVGFALLLFGQVEPFYGVLKSFPPFDLAADTRMLPLVGVGLAILVALAIDDLARGRAATYGRAFLRVAACVGRRGGNGVPVHLVGVDGTARDGLAVAVVLGRSDPADETAARRRLRAGPRSPRPRAYRDRRGGGAAS